MARFTRSITTRSPRVNKIKREEDTQKEKFERLVRNIPLILTGKRPRRNATERRIYNAFWSAIVLSLFKDIYEGYEIKSQGLPDETGNQWPDLAPVTKAYKKNKRGYLNSSQRRRLKSDTPGLLSPSQWVAWKKKYSEVLRAELHGMKKRGVTVDKKVAEKKAAASAWVDAKERGAQTLIGVLGDADMLIMRETDTLYNSFQPGKIVGGKYRKGDENQAVLFSPGQVEIGTKVSYAKLASREIKTFGGVGKSFRREFLPKRLGVWYDRAVEAGRDALAEELQKVAKQKRF